MTSRKLLTLPDRQAQMREQHRAPGPQAVTGTFAQRHYTPSELAGMWNMHASTVRRIFEGFPGVLKLSVSGPQASRRYVSLRIPASIAEAWHREHSS